MALLVGVTVFCAALFGILTRIPDFLATFWPANALMLGLMLRWPRLAHPLGWLAGATGFLTADLLTGSTLFKTAVLTAANLAGIAAGYVAARHLDIADRGLRRPSSVIRMILVIVVAAVAAACGGAIANPILFGLPPGDGWVTWFATELVNYIAILPVVLTIPVRPGRLRIPAPDWPMLAPLAALAASAGIAVLIGGPGAIAFPVPALLWCALRYGLFANALIAFGISAVMLIGLATGAIAMPPEIAGQHALISLRIGVTLIALTPIAISSVMADRAVMMQRLHEMATRDQLTGVANRRHFDHEAREAMDRAAAAGQPVAAMMLDIDRFKAINDTHGHAIGDEVLKAFTRQVSAMLRPGDLFARVGGEEFAVILPGMMADEAAALAERVRQAIADQAMNLPDGRLLRVTVSIGVAVAAEFGTGPSPLLIEADRALYDAKEAGRDRVAHRLVPRAAWAGA
ncbi:diguanylate cyclase [Tistrella mobilis]|uniref:GGDEF domain-containing protein n=1 Tax=Tistrella mobilis TaxID=171437 RepID=UPI003558178A